MTVRRFQSFIWQWCRANGRHGLPWRKFPRTLPAGRQAYRILVSEIMLQQTQVSRVIPKYREFLKAFPTLSTLDRAPLASVLTTWQGMGYNRRAVYLKRLARMVTVEYGGRIPSDPDTLKRLPGIGPGTAGAIAAFAFNRRIAFIETNIRRVFIHHFFKRRGRINDAEILEKIRQTLPRRNIREWYYALMDYGASAFRGRPNPNRRSVHHVRQVPFTGSRRELRGRILAAVIRGPIPENKLAHRIGGATRPFGRRELGRTIGAMIREGLIEIRAHRIALPYG